MHYVDGTQSLLLKIISYTNNNNHNRIHLHDPTNTNIPNPAHPPDSLLCNPLTPTLRFNHTRPSHRLSPPPPYAPSPLIEHTRAEAGRGYWMLPRRLNPRTQKSDTGLILPCSTCDAPWDVKGASLVSAATMTDE